MKRVARFILSLFPLLLLMVCMDSRVAPTTFRSFYPGDVENITLIQVIAYQDNRMITLSDPTEIKRWIKQTDRIPLEIEAGNAPNWYVNLRYTFLFREGTSQSFTFRYKEMQGVYDEVIDGQSHPVLFTGTQDYIKPLAYRFAKPASDEQLADPTRPEVALVYDFVRLSFQGKYDEAAHLLINGKENPNYGRGPTEQSLLKSMTILRMWDISDRPYGFRSMDEDTPYWESRTIFVEYTGKWKGIFGDVTMMKIPRYDIYTICKTTATSPWLIDNITSGPPEWVEDFGKP